MCRKIGEVLENPAQSLRFGILFGLIGAGLMMAGFLGPSRLFYCRYVAIPFIVFWYICFQAHCKNRHRNRPNQLAAHVNVAVEAQPGQQSRSTQPCRPEPFVLSPGTGGTVNDVSDAQSQGNSNVLGSYSMGEVPNDPSIPPPPPPYQQIGIANLPPPPSYDEVMRGSR